MSCFYRRCTSCFLLGELFQWPLLFFMVLLKRLSFLPYMKLTSSCIDISFKASSLMVVSLRVLLSCLFSSLCLACLSKLSAMFIACLRLWILLSGCYLFCQFIACDLGKCSDIVHQCYLTSLFLRCDSMCCFMYSCIF